MDELIIDDITEIINDCSLRDQSIILLMLTSGMSPADVLELTIDDFINSILRSIEVDQFLININRYRTDKVTDYVNWNKIGIWDLTRLKTGIRYITFSTNECNQSILDYLNTRMNFSFFPNEPLFADQRRNKLSQKYIFTLFKELSYNSEKNITPQLLRNLFTYTLYKQGADKYFVNTILGHNLDQFDFEPEIKTATFKKKYSKFAEHLTLKKNGSDLDE